MKKALPFIVGGIAVILIWYGGYKVGTRQAVIPTEELRQLVAAQQAANDATKLLLLQTETLKGAIDDGLQDLRNQQETLVNIEEKRLFDLIEQQKQVDSLRDTLLQAQVSLKRLKEIAKTLDY